MNPEMDDQMVHFSQYYQSEMYNQFASEQDITGGGAETQKPRRRRKKNKGSDVNDAMMRKRKLSEEQVNMLEISFGNEHKLESERKDKLAAELGLDPRQVAVWFQNRRARYKSKKVEEEYLKLKSEHDSTVVQKCRIEEEYLKLKSEHDSTVVQKCRLETEMLKLKEQLVEHEKEIQRLERSDGFSSQSPTSSFSMEAMQEPPYLGEFGYEGLENVVYNTPQNSYLQGMGWDNFYYMN